MHCPLLNDKVEYFTVSRPAQLIARVFFDQLDQYGMLAAVLATWLAVSSLAVTEVIVSRPTHCAYPPQDDQAELAEVAGLNTKAVYMYIRKTNIRLCTNRAPRRAVESGGGIGVSYPGPHSVGGAPRSLGGEVRSLQGAPWLSVVPPGPKLALNGPDSTYSNFTDAHNIITTTPNHQPWRPYGILRIIHDTRVNKQLAIQLYL